MNSQSQIKRSRLNGTMDNQTFEWQWRPTMYQMYDKHPYVVSTRLAFYFPPDIGFETPPNFFNSFIRNCVSHIRHNVWGGMACNKRSFWRLKVDCMGYSFYECVLLYNSSMPELYLGIQREASRLWMDYLTSLNLNTEMQNLCFMQCVTKHLLTSYSENGVQLILGQNVDVNFGAVNDPMTMIWNPMELKMSYETQPNSPDVTA